MIAIGAILIAVAAIQSRTQTQTQLATLKLEGNKNVSDNDRTSLLFDPSKAWARNVLAGNWAWGRPGVQTPSGTKPYWRKPTPEGSGWVDWSAEGNQWLRGPEYRTMYVGNYRNAYSTELQQALRTQLVPGYQHETITKGRVLTQEIKADGVYNPNGPNLYRYVT